MKLTPDTKITWENFHEYATLNAGEQARLERTVRRPNKMDDPLADMVAHILASPHCYGE